VIRKASPPGWRQCTMADLFKVKHGFAFDGKYFASEGEYVLLSPGNFNDAGGFKLKDKEKYFTGDIPEEYVLSEGDLLVAMTEQAEGLLGSSALIPSSNRFLHNQRLGLITDWKATEIDLRFLYYLFNTREVRTQIRASATGTKVRHTSPTRIGEVRVVIPRVETQRTIASVLSAYDSLIENNDRRIAILEEMAQSLYREWFVEYRFPDYEITRFVDSPLGRIPKGWGCTTVGDLCSLMRAGGTPERKNEAYWSGGSIDWYKTKELQDCFLLGSEEQITEIAATNSTTRLFNQGTILMAIYGSPTVGRLGILTKQSACNQAALAMVPDPAKASLPFLFHVLLNLRSHFNTIAAGAAQQNISKAKVEAATCVLPPPRLIEESDALCRPVFDELRCLAKKTLLLRHTRDLLLPKLMSGQLDVEDLDIDTGEPLAGVEA